MTERFIINNGTFSVYYPVDTHEACGKNGQIKGVSCFGRTIELGGVELNRGSAIDFLREQVIEHNNQHAGQLDLPEKGWFFGLCCGSTDDEIINIFNTLYPNASPERVFLMHADEHVGENDYEAIALYEQAAALGSSRARLALASYYETGDVVIQDTNKALEYFSQVVSDDASEDSDLAFAHFKIAKITAETNLNDALDHYIQSYFYHISKNIQDKQFCDKSLDAIRMHTKSLGELYAIGSDYIETDPDKALHFFWFCSDFDHREASHQIIRFYEENPLFTQGFLPKLAERGHVEANYVLGLLSEQQEDFDLAYTSYTNAANSGNAYAMYALGKMHETIEGFKDDEKAHHFYTQAEELRKLP